MISAAPVQTVKIHQVANRILCSSNGIYPKPELNWSTIPPSNIFLQSSTIVQPTEQQLYSISSSLRVSSETSLSYSCTIGTRSSSRTASLLNQDETGEGRKILIIIMIDLERFKKCIRQIQRSLDYKFKFFQRCALSHCSGK